MASVDEPRRVLARLIELLSDIQARMVLRFIRTIRQEPVMVANPVSDLMANAEFAREFATGLAFHHALQESPLTKKAFEYLFRDACQAAGWDAQIGASATYPGADILVNGVGISLKTEGAANIRADLIHISKFRESAATKTMTRPDEFQQFIQTVLLPHLLQYDRIIMLRSFSLSRLSTWRGRPTPLKAAASLTDQAFSMLESAAHDGNRVVYLLVEIPVSLLRLMGQLLPEEIELLGTAGSAKARVVENQETVFNLFFDGSDNKVQLQSILMSRCVLHGMWSIPLQAAAEAN